MISHLGHSFPSPFSLWLEPILGPVVQALASAILYRLLKSSRSSSGKPKGDELRRNDSTPHGGANTGPALPTLPVAPVSWFHPESQTASLAQSEAASSWLVGMARLGISLASLFFFSSPLPLSQVWPTFQSTDLSANVPFLGLISER